MLVSELVYLALKMKEVCKKSKTSEALESLSKRLEKCMEEFEEEKKVEFVAIIAEIEKIYCCTLDMPTKTKIKNKTNGVSGGILSHILKSLESPYNLFYTEKIQSLLFQLLSKHSSFPSSHKVEALSSILRSLNTELCFSNLTERYKLLDTFTFSTQAYGKISFRNYCLLECLSKLIMESSEKDHLYRILDSIDILPDFLVYLLRSNSSLLLIYSSLWIDQYESGKSPSTTLISKILPKYVDIRKKHIISQEKITECKGKLYCCCRKCTALVFKKVFLLFISLINKQKLPSMKVLKVFSKAELKALYKKLKGKAAFVKIFSQLDHEYLVKELRKKNSKALFFSINPAEISQKSLFVYYSSYFNLLITDASSMKEEIKRQKIKIVNLEAFAEAFNKVYDKAFVENMNVELGLYHRGKIVDMDEKKISLSVSSMLVYYTITHNKLFVDPVWVGAPVIDLSHNPLTPNEIALINNVLWILYNVYETLPQALKGSILASTKKLVFTRCFLFRSGLLLSKYNIRTSLDALITSCKSMSLDQNIAWEILSVVDSASFATHVDTAPHFSLVYWSFKLLESNECEKMCKILPVLKTSLAVTSQIGVLVLKLLEMTGFTRGIGAEVLFNFAAENIESIFCFIETPFKAIATNLLIKLLRARAVPPLLIIPKIISIYDSSYIKKHFREAALNATPEVLKLVANRIIKMREERHLGSNTHADPLEFNDADLSDFTLSYIIPLDIQDVIKKITFCSPTETWVFLHSLRHLKLKDQITICQRIEGLAYNENVRQIVEQFMENLHKRSIGL